LPGNPKGGVGQAPEKEIRSARIRETLVAVSKGVSSDRLIAVCFRFLQNANVLPRILKEGGFEMAKKKTIHDFHEMKKKAEKITFLTS
jgi:hypothetical protein